MKKIAKKIKLNGPVVSGGNSFIYDWLGIETISPKRVIGELNKAAGDDVELYINSGGGSVFAGSEIFTALKEYKGKITSKVTGVAASAATFFLLASDEVFVTPLGQLMIHNAATYTEGDKGTHASSIDLLEGVDKSIAKVYQAKTKLPENEILELMQKTTWMTAEKAVQLGFANGVLFDEEVDVNNSFELGTELPQGVIDKLKNELLKNVMRNNPIDNAQATNDPVNQVTPTNERNDKQMNLEELKAQHPELYNQVFALGKEEGEVAGKAAGKEEGTKNERERIKDIEDLAAPGNEAIIAEAKESGATAMDTYKKIVAANKAKQQAMAANMQSDAQNSNVNNVNAGAAPQNDGGDDDEKQVQNYAGSIVAAMKRMRGVK